MGEERKNGERHRLLDQSAVQRVARPGTAYRFSMASIFLPNVTYFLVTVFGEGDAHKALDRFNEIIHQTVEHLGALPNKMSSADVLKTVFGDLDAFSKLSEAGDCVQSHAADFFQDVAAYLAECAREADPGGAPDCITPSGIERAIQAAPKFSLSDCLDVVPSDISVSESLDMSSATLMAMLRFMAAMPAIYIVLAALGAILPFVPILCSPAFRENLKDPSKPFARSATWLVLTAIIFACVGVISTIAYDLRPFLSFDDVSDIEDGIASITQPVSVTVSPKDLTVVIAFLHAYGGNITADVLHACYDFMGVYCNPFDAKGCSDNLIREGNDLANMTWGNQSQILVVSQALRNELNDLAQNATFRQGVWDQVQNTIDPDVEKVDVVSHFASTIKDAIAAIPDKIGLMIITLLNFFLSLVVIGKYKSEVAEAEPDAPSQFFP